MPPLSETAKRKLRTSRFALSIYWLTMFIGSHVPMQGGPVANHLDKLVHFGAFALLAFLMANYLGQLRRMTRTSYAMILAIAAGYGVFDELTQKFVPGRTGDLLDWFADLAGALTGLGAYALYQRYIHGPASQGKS